MHCNISVVSLSYWLKEHNKISKSHEHTFYYNFIIIKYTSAKRLMTSYKNATITAVRVHTNLFKKLKLIKFKQINSFLVWLKWNSPILLVRI